jgi:hypothetical protein
MLAGMPARTGSVVSCTVTVKASEVLLPARSLATQVTVVVAEAKVLPVAGEHDICTPPGSVAVGAV